ncbi:MAG: hypothetical protein ACRELB_23480, partial [Polyangiaceae bacterium]
VTKSLSRVMTEVLKNQDKTGGGDRGAKHRAANGKLREVLATFEKNRDLIAVGAYEKGSDPKIDYAIDKIEEVETFLKQRTDEKPVYEETIDRLIAMFEGQI